MMLGSLMVSIGADISGFLTGIQAVQARLQSFSSQAAAHGQTASNGFGGALSSMAGHLGGFGGALLHAGGSVLGFAGSVAGFAMRSVSFIGGLKGMADMALNTAKALFAPNAQLEQLQIAFAGLLHSGPAAASFLKDMMQFAGKTPFQFPDLAKASQMLIGVGMSAKDVQPALVAIGDTLSGVGKTGAVNLQQVVYAFSKMQSQGKITYGTMAEMVRLGIPGWQELSASTGKTTTQLQEMAKKGLLPAAQYLPLLEQGMEKTFGGQMAKQALTFNGLITTLEDNVRLAYITITGPLFDLVKKGLLQLTNLVSSPAFQDFATMIGTKVAGALTKMTGALSGGGGGGLFGNLVTSIKGIAPALGGGIQEFVKFSGVADLVKASMLLISNLFASFHPNLSLNTAQLSGFSAAAKSTGEILGSTVKPVVQFLANSFGQLATILSGKAAPAVNDIGNSFRDGFGKAAQIIGGEFAREMQFAQQTVAQLGGWIKSTLLPAINEAAPKFAGLANILMSDLVPILAQAFVVGRNFETGFVSILIPILERLIPIVIKVGGAIAEWLGKALHFVAPYVMEALKALQQFIGEIVSRILPIIKQFFDNVDQGLAAFQTIWTFIWPLLSKILKGVWDEIVGVVQIAWAIVKGIIEIGLDILSGNWKQAWTDFQTMLSGIWSGIQTYLKGAWEIISGIASTIWGGIADFFKGIWNKVTGFFQQGWNDISSQFRQSGTKVGADSQNIWNGITSHIKGAWDAITGGIGNAMSAVGTTIHNGWLAADKATGGTLSSILKYIQGIFQTIWNIIVKVMQDVMTALTNKWNQISNEISAVWNAIVYIIDQKLQQFFDSVQKWLKTAQEFMAARWSDIQGTVGAVWGWITTKIATAWQAISDRVTGAITNVRNILRGAWNTISGDVSAVWNTIWNKISSILTSIWNTIANKIAPIRNAIMSPFQQAANAIGGVVRTFANGAIGILNGMLGSLQGFLNDFGSAINNVANAVGAGAVVPSVSIGRVPYLAKGTSNFAGGPAIVGEEGPELVMLPRGTAVLPHRQTKQMLQGMGHGRHIPGFAGGVGDFFGSLVSWIGGGIGSVMGHIFTGSLGLGGAFAGIGNSIGGLIQKFGTTALNKLLGGLQNVLGGGGGGSSFSGGGSLAGWIASAIGLTGVPGSWLGPLETIAMHESGGNPNAINNWDSNAAAGTPSEGLMQTIMPTFLAYAVPGHGNILNPVDNAAAAIGYILSRYGSVFNVPGIVSMEQGGPYVGYANGGVIDEKILGVGMRTGTKYAFGENGPETIVPGSRGGAQTVNVIIELDGRVLVQALGQPMVDYIRIKTGSKF